MRFAMAAKSAAELTNFMRTSTLITVPAVTLRDELLRGDDGEVLRKCAAALQSHLESLEGASESMLAALMPAVRPAADAGPGTPVSRFDAAGQGNGQTSSDMSTKLRLLTERAAPSAAPSQSSVPSMPLTVRVSTDADFKGLDEDRPEPRPSR